MSSSKFAETHNLVYFLEKPVESEGFKQIIDFLNASSIKYALTINPTIYHSCVQQLWESAKVNTVNDEVQIQALMDKKRVVISEASIRRDLKLRDADGIACVKFYMFPRFVKVFVTKKLGDMSHHKKAFAAPSLTKKQKQKSKRKPRRETEAFSSAQQSVPTTSSSDPPHSGEDSMQLNELMIFCTSLQEQILNLQKDKDAQREEIAALKNKVKKIEGRRRQRTSSLRRLKKVGMGARVVSSDDEGLVAKEDTSKQGRNDEEEMLFDVDADLQGEEVIVDEAQNVVGEVIKDITTAGNEDEISTAPQVTTALITSIELTLAQTLVEIRNTTKPKVKGISIVEPSEATTTTKTVQSLGKDKGKSILIEPERPMKRKAQIQANEELA
ncbi:hypothetical protein Tco_0140004 [Tanacetum coccineum]